MLSGGGATVALVREVGISYRWRGEGPGPDEGDVLISNSGLVYLILARQVKARSLAGVVLRLQCAPVDPSAVPSQAAVFDMEWGERRVA